MNLSSQKAEPFFSKKKKNIEGFVLRFFKPLYMLICFLFMEIPGHKMLTYFYGVKNLRHKFDRVPFKDYFIKKDFSTYK